MSKRQDNFAAWDTSRASDTQDVIDALYGAFTWSDSEEGSDFWADISNRLENIVIDAKEPTK